MSPYRVLEDLELDPDGEGYALLGTPLYYASRFGLFEVVEQLLDGTCYSEIDSLGGLLGSPLTAAVNGECDGPVSENHRRIVSLLIQNGAQVNKHGPLGGNALRWALAPGNECILRQLIACGGDIHTTDDMNVSLLHHATETDNALAIEILLASGADLETIDSKGKTPIFWAVERWGKDKALHCILEHGADVNKADSSGKTPLHYCVDMRDPDCTIALLRAGASLRIRDSQGRLPFDDTCLSTTKRQQIDSALTAITLSDQEAQKAAKEWMPYLRKSVHGTVTADEPQCTSQL